MRRKAEFQMSLGFVVAIVFAIVLLSLSLTWLRGLLDQITGLTDDLTEQAQSTLRDAFRGGDSSSFAIWPTTYSLRPGRGFKMSAGIDNDAAEAEDHLYVINVIPAAADSSIFTASRYGNCLDFDSCDELKEDMERWVSFPTRPLKVEVNNIGFIPITVTLPDNPVKGSYIYDVVACYDKYVKGSPPPSEKCTAISDELWGGSAQGLVVTVV